MVAVLLQGNVDDLLCSSILHTLSSVYSKKEKLELLLVVDSPGGQTKAALDFILRLKQYESQGLKLTVQIQNAHSAAALIALSVGERRTMHYSGKLSLHTGHLRTIEASDFDEKTGQIKNDQVLAEFRRYQCVLETILTKFGLDTNQKLMGTFYGSNWLKLNAAECKALGLVDFVF
jgi:ATP-dependent protease ClpP protease subunit